MDALMDAPMDAPMDTLMDALMDTLMDTRIMSGFLYLATMLGNVSLHPLKWLML